MEIIEVTKQTTLMLGHQGEHLARRMEFDLSGWVECYGDGTAELIHQRPGDEKPYPVATVREGNKLVWPVSNTDTAVASSFNSTGHCELRWYVGDVVVKSQTWRTWVSHAMGTPAETEPSAPEQGWVDQVVATGAASKTSANSAKADAERAVALAADVTAKAAQTAHDATVSAQAMDAAQSAQSHAEAAQKVAEAARDRAERAAIRQPYPNVETGTWWLWDANTGSYKDSHIKSDGNDGKPGKDGEPGKDGYTPVKGVDYFDGKPGKDGYTPQKGVDYFDGADGKDGRDGVAGHDGKSAYQSAAEAGFTGTEQAFSTALERVPAHLDDTVTHITSEEREAWNAKQNASFQPKGDAYLTFRSPKPFNLQTYKSIKGWDGVLQYFNADRTWTEWDGSAAIASVDSIGAQVIYLRGIGNTVMTGNEANSSWVLSGSEIACIGNIETLLDYTTVSSGNHPAMGIGCFAYLFLFNSGLTVAPELPATTLSKDCYQNMFRGCENLISAPELPATALAESCYRGMFSNCSKLMYAPELPAQTLAYECYCQMFTACSHLLSAPELPATRLEDTCYAEMFKACTSLTTIPKLPATELPNACYQHMFRGCTALKLSATKTGAYTKAYSIPCSGENPPADNALRELFGETGGTFVGTPEVNTTYYLSSDNHILGEVDDHLVNTHNPHGVTAEQIGAVSEEYVGSKLAEKITAPATASVGQTIRVKIVDENGKPTEWEAVDAPSGGGLYQHDIFLEDAENGCGSFLFRIISHVDTPFTTYEELFSYCRETDGDKWHTVMNGFNDSFIVTDYFEGSEDAHLNSIMLYLRSPKYINVAGVVEDWLFDVNTSSLTKKYLGCSEITLQTSIFDFTDTVTPV